MSGINAIPVRECLGWKPSEDGQAVLVGFQTEGGHFSIAMDEQALKEAIFNLIQATSVFKNPKAQSGERLFVAINWIDFGVTSDGKLLNLSVYFPAGGDMAFQFPLEMGERLLGDLEILLGRTPMDPSPGTIAH
jgi:hypothetical protein